MRTRGFIIVLLLITLTACKNKEIYITSAEIPVDSFVLENINLESRINFYPSDTDLLINFVSNNTDKSLFYSVDKSQSIDSVFFDKRDLNEQYYIDNHKTTYVYNNNQNSLLIRNDSGKEHYLYIKPEYIYHSWDTFTRNYSAVSLPLQVIDSILILNNFQGYQLADKRERELYFKRENLSSVKIGTDSLIKKNEFAAFPEFYHKKYINEHWPVAARVGNNVYYLYSNDNILYNYDIAAGKTVQNRVEGLDPNKTEPYNIDRIADFSYTGEYEIKVSSYLRLLHDYKTNEFLVFQMLPVKTKKKDGMLSLYEDKPLLLNLVNNSMTVYKKIYFSDHSKFNLMYACYYNGKLYITERFSRSNSSKSSLKMYVYNVK